MGKLILVIVFLCIGVACAATMGDAPLNSTDVEREDSSFTYYEEEEENSNNFETESSENEKEIYYCPDRRANEFINDYNKNSKNQISPNDISYIETGAGYETTISFKSIDFIISYADMDPYCSIVSKIPYNSDNLNTYFKEAKKVLLTFFPSFNKEDINEMIEELKKTSYASEKQIIKNGYYYVFHIGDYVSQKEGTEYVLIFSYMSDY